jgi:hypothetical protein
MPKYLFCPEDVQLTLRDVPLISQVLKDPAREGEASLAFPHARKSPRELYRILSSQHYPHLRDLLATMESCLKHGWKQNNLLRTRSNAQFNSELASLRFAEHLFGLGFEPKNLDAAKGRSSVPDIHVQTPSGPLSVEVYVPRDWEGFSSLLEEVRVGLLHLDCPWDYSVEVSVSVPISGIPVAWSLLDLYEKKPIRVAVDRILEPVVKHLNGKRVGPLDLIIPEPDAPGVEYDLRLSNLRCARERLPMRSAVISYLMSGLAPEGMFQRLLSRRVVPKIRKNQCGHSGTNARRLLFVATNLLAYRDDFKAYRENFADSIRKILPGESQNIDAVMFGPTFPFSVDILACLTQGAEEMAQYLGVDKQTSVLKMYKSVA